MRSFLKLEHETEEEFKLFLVYRDTDPHLRNLDRIAELTGHPREYIYDLAERNEWKDRALAYDLSLVNAYQKTAALYCARAQAELMKTITLTLARISEALEPLDMRYASLDDFQKITTFLAKLIVPTKKVLETSNLSALEPEIDAIFHEAQKLASAWHIKPQDHELDQLLEEQLKPETPSQDQDEL